MTAPPRTTRVLRRDLRDRHQAAEMLGVHPNTIDRMGARGDLRRFRIRGVRGYFYLAEEIETCIVEVGPDA